LLSSNYMQSLSLCKIIDTLSVFFSQFIAIQVLGSNNIWAFQIKMYTNEWKFMFGPNNHTSQFTIERVLSFH
jgi:hypothetical protein